MFLQFTYRVRHKELNALFQSHRNLWWKSLQFEKYINLLLFSAFFSGICLFTRSTGLEMGSHQGLKSKNKSLRKGVFYYLASKSKNWIFLLFFWTCSCWSTPMLVFQLKIKPLQVQKQLENSNHSLWVKCTFSADIFLLQTLTTPHF